jgi:LDH2 family malate/lactate/ureidoglycolate dehydrogenase
VRIPGDPERLAQQERALTGIPLTPAVARNLQELANRWSLPWPDEAR